MGSIRKRKNKDGTPAYRVDVRLKGFPPQRATFKRLTDAKKWEQHTEAAIREGRYFKIAEAKKHTLAELIDRYIQEILPKKPKQQRGQSQQLRWWKSEIGAHSLTDVTPALITQARDKLASEPTHLDTIRSPATINRYMAALSHAFTIAVNEWGWLEDSPMRKVRKPSEPRGRVRFLSDDERERLLMVCKESDNPYLYPVVVLAISTGMRRGEIMGLKWDDVDLDRGRITLYDTKNKDIRVVPAVGLAMEVLKDHAKIKWIDTPLLFPSRTNPLKPIDLRSPWESALKSAAIEDFRFHDLRHTAASYLAMSGATLAEIAEICRCLKAEGLTNKELAKRLEITSAQLRFILGRDY